MTLTQFQFNSTDGTVVTTGNSGLSQLVSGTGSTQTYRSAAAFSGATGIRFVSDGTNFSCALANFGANANTASFSFRFKIPTALPSTTLTIFGASNTAGSYALYLRYTTAGVLQAYDNGGNTYTILSAAQATAGTSFRFEIVITNVSTTAGAFTARAYSTGSTQVGTTASSTTANLGSTQLNKALIGLFGAAVATLDYDNLQFNDGGTTEIGELGANTTPPTVTAGANQTTTVGTPTNLTCTAVPAAGSIASYSWTLVSAISNTGAAISAPTITNSTGQTASFTPTTKGRYVFQVTATDTNGNTSLPSQTRVFLPDSNGVPIEVTGNNWPAGTVAPLQDASDATYDESGAAGTNQVLTLRLSPLVPASSGFSLDVRSMVQAVGGSQQVALLEGATVRKDWGAISPGTSFGDTLLTLSAAEMATVGSWNELDLRLTQV